MKTTKEMIEVMQAYERGEQIQVFDINGIWEDKEHPYWNWTQCDYRVKPKKIYVPFDTAEEFLAAQRKHGKKLIAISDYGILKSNDIYINIDGIAYKGKENKHCYELYYIGDLKYLFKNCKFSDGTPCGKEVKA